MTSSTVGELDLAGALVFSINLVTPFRGLVAREGMLIQGPRGWGEFSPFVEYDDQEAASWLATAVEQCTRGWPPAVRDRIPINCIVPAVRPEQAAAIVASSGCQTAKVKVAASPDSLAQDCARVGEVRQALGPRGAIRVDANGAWDAATAVTAIAALEQAAGGLQYVEQPCASLAELAQVRAQVSVPIAADEAIRRAEDPLRVALAGAADLAVIKCAPLGGVRRSLAVAAAAGLPCVVSSALETSVGLAAEIALAAALPQLDYACGLGTLSLLQTDVIRPGPRITEGHLNVADVPSVLDLDHVRGLAPDSARQAWWHRRLGRVAALI